MEGRLTDHITSKPREKEEEHLIKLGLNIYLKPSLLKALDLIRVSRNWNRSRLKMPPTQPILLKRSFDDQSKRRCTVKKKKKSDVAFG